MRTGTFLASAASVALIAPFLTLPALAQQADPAPAPAAPAAAAVEEEGTIIVTATRRSQALSDVPIAVSAVLAEDLARTGAVDIRTLNQVSPSLLVSSTSSEAGAGVARIRGIGTVGDNPGLESSVGVFIDGVYRNRSGVALTELGAVERIEVLRGPQGTLFGRNTSAGLINIITAQPKFENEGYAAFTLANYEGYRVEGGFTGPVGKGDTVAMRFDGVWFQRDGFIRDVISDDRVNNRDRFLLRGQLLIEPTDDLSIRLIGDFAKRNEDCCAAIYAPLVDRVRSGSDVTTAPSIFAPVLRGLNDPAGNPGYLNDDIEQGRTAITPGRSYRSDVRDWGLSGEVNWDLGFGNLTSITAYRDWDWDRGQDADFNNLDLFYRDGYEQSFQTFSQELRLQGEAFDGRLDWLVGGYYASEKLEVKDRLRLGSQYDLYASNVIAFANPALAAFRNFGFANLRAFTDLSLTAQGVPASARAPVVALVRNLDLTDVGETSDDFEQNSRNFALFTHNVVSITDRFSVTLGLRYTNERKEYDSSFNSDNTACADILRSIADLRALAAAAPPLAPVANGTANNLQGLTPFPCLINLNTNFDLDLGGERQEDEFSGTAVLSFKATDDLLLYGSYSRGYKAGGFNLDRSALNPANPRVQDLEFEPEKVNAFEVGAKYDGRTIDVNVALFWQEFDQFQLNTFNGLSFLVENIQACSDDLGTPPPGLVFGGCTGDVEAGVRSRGIEVEVFSRPIDNVQLNAGLTYADTTYKERLVGTGGRPIPNDLFRLPGEGLSNAPKFVGTVSASWTPPLGDKGYSALFYVDGRYQTRYNTGSDLDIEKFQDALFLMNGRFGLRGPDERWSFEIWAQNIFDKRYTQVAFDAPLQPIGGVAGSRVTDLPAGTTFAANRSTQLYGRFLGEPRTWGITARTRF